MQMPSRRSGLFVLMAACACAAWGADALQKGATLEATGNVTLRSTPPEQRLGIFVQNAGKEVHTVPGGARLKVEAIDKVKVPFDTHTWVKVRTDKGAEGWAYYGNEASTENFKLK